MSLAERSTAWLDSGRLPDWVVRRGIRAILRTRLRDERRRQRTTAFIAELADGPIALHTADANAQHYEVPAAFYQHVLGPHLKYSACLWPDAGGSLADAEAHMLSVTAERADLANGQQVLELGCGWGSLSLYMAARYPDSRIVAVSNSHSQRQFIEAAAAARGLANLQVITADMNTFDPRAAGIATRFDRVVSVEMFEHMRNYPRLLARIAAWMHDEGRLFVHVFVHREFAYPYEAEGATDWMAEHFFSGGTMPSEGLLPSFQSDVVVEAQWRINGTHYARTCEAWLDNMDRHRRDVDQVLALAYGATEVTRWRARWRTFFMACAELFAFRGGQEWFVAHYRFRPRRDGLPIQGAHT